MKYILLISLLLSCSKTRLYKVGDCFIEDQTEGIFQVRAVMEHSYYAFLYSPKWWKTMNKDLPAHNIKFVSKYDNLVPIECHMHSNKRDRKLWIETIWIEWYTNKKYYNKGVKENLPKLRTIK